MNEWSRRAADIGNPDCDEGRQLEEEIEGASLEADEENERDKH